MIGNTIAGRCFVVGEDQLIEFPQRLCDRAVTVEPGAKAKAQSLHV
jgi:hypothetical protein